MITRLCRRDQRLASASGLNSPVPPTTRRQIQAPKAEHDLTERLRLRNDSPGAARDNCRLHEHDVFDWNSGHARPADRKQADETAAPSIGQPGHAVGRAVADHGMCGRWEGRTRAPCFLTE